MTTCYHTERKTVDENGDTVRGVKCRAEGTERHTSAWFCPQHLPAPRSANCSHSLAPSGQCAYCGFITDPDVFRPPVLAIANTKPAPVDDAQVPLW